MTYRFIINGCYDCGYFDIRVNKRIEYTNYMYIRFSSDKSSKIVCRFYKDDVCKGGKPADNSVIDKIGFFDAGYQNWTEFEFFIKDIIYDYYIRDYDIIELNPLHVGYANIIKTKILDL